MKRKYADDSEKQRAYRERNLEKVRERERAWDEKNREKRNAISQAWRDRNPEKFKESYRASYERNKEKCLERARDWKRRNRERMKATEKAHYEKHPEKLTEKYRKYRKAHPEKSLTDGAIRRARIYKGKTAKFTAAELRARLAMFGGKCWMCGQDADQVDHVIPLAKGGPHVLANLRPACGPCNRRKGARHVKRAKAAV